MRNQMAPAFRFEWLLGFAIACAAMFFTGRAAATEEIKVGGSGAAMGTIQLLADAFAKQNPDFRVRPVHNLGGTGSIKALVAGAIDLSVTSRPLRAEERALGVTEIEYARTPFVFAVSTKSTVTAVTIRQLAEIYAGEMVNWPDGSVVRIVLRPATDIDTDIIKSMSPAMQRALSVAQQRRGVAVSPTDDEAANDIERIAGAIGPSSTALVISEKRALRALKLDGVEPSAASIASGAYPYYKRLFLVTGAKRTPAVERFIAFIQSPAGYKVLAQTEHWIP